MAGAYQETATRALEGLWVGEMLQLSRCAIEIKNPQVLPAMAAA